MPCSVAIGNTYVFCGHRNQTGDFLFGEQWTAWRDAGVVSDVFCAFSRDQDRKIYVQDKIREQAALIFKLLTQENATVIVAGNSQNMPKDVRRAIIDVLQQGLAKAAGSSEPTTSEWGQAAQAGDGSTGAAMDSGNPDAYAAPAEAFVRQMERTRRYLLECWS